MSLSNFIKSILNIQDNNISFPEEDYCQVIQNGNYIVKVFKGFLKADYCSCPYCNSKNIILTFIKNHIIVQALSRNLVLRIKKNLSKKERVSKQMLTALKKYMKHIENIFELNVTNGLIEGLNNKIKSTKRTAFGYSILVILKSTY